MKTVRIQQDIECRGWTATPNRKRVATGRDYFMSFNTSMPFHESASGGTVDEQWQHDPAVEVRDIRRLAIWAHNYTFDSANKITATLIFAALGGTIDGGATTTNIPKWLRTANTSSIACDVAVEMLEGTHSGRCARSRYVH